MDMDRSHIVNDGSLTVCSCQTTDTAGTITGSANEVVLNNAIMFVTGGSITGSCFGITNKGTLTVSGGKVEGDEYGILNRNTLNICGDGTVFGMFGISNRSAATANISDSARVEGSWTGIDNKAGGTVTVSDTATVKGDTSAVYNEGTVVIEDSACITGYSAGIDNEGTAIVTGGTVTATNTVEGYSPRAINVQAGGSLAVSGDCTIIGYTAISNSGTTEISGGIVRSSDPTSTARAIGNSGNLMVSDGTVECSTGFGIFTHGTGDVAPAVTVTGGIITARIGIGGSYRSGAIQVSGDTVTVTGTDHSIDVCDAELYLSGTPTITGSIRLANKAIYANSQESGEGYAYTGEPLHISLSNPEAMVGQVVVYYASAQAGKFLLDGEGKQGLLQGTGDNASHLILAAHVHANGVQDAPVNFDTEWSGEIGESTLEGNVNIVLTADTTFTGRVKVAQGATVNLCLNGHTLALGKNPLTCYGTLNICDCGEAGQVTSTTAHLDNRGQMNLSGITVRSSSGWGIYSYAGTLTVSRCTVDAYNNGIYSIGGTATVSSSSVTSATDAAIWNNATLEISGDDTVISGRTSGVEHCGGSLTVTGGMVIGGNFGIESVSEGTLTVSGGKIRSVATGIKCKGITVNIAGGEVSGGPKGIDSENCTITVSDGDVVATNMEESYAIYLEESALTVSGDSGIQGNATVGVWVNDGSQVTITGGMVSGMYAGVQTKEYNLSDHEIWVKVSGGEVTGGTYGIHNVHDLFLSGSPMITGSVAALYVAKGSLYAREDGAADGEPYQGGKLTMHVTYPRLNEVAVFYADLGTDQFTLVNTPGFRLAQGEGDNIAHLVLTEEKYTVTFDPNGGSGESFTALSYLAEDSELCVQLPWEPPFTKDGYTFMGWSDRADYARLVGTYDSEGSLIGWSNFKGTDPNGDPVRFSCKFNAVPYAGFKISGPTTLYAVWAKNVLDVDGDGIGDLPVLALVETDSEIPTTVTVLESYFDGTSFYLQDGIVTLDLNGMTVEQSYLVVWSGTLTLEGHGGILLGSIYLYDAGATATLKDLTVTGGVSNTRGTLIIESGTYYGLMIDPAGTTVLNGGSFLLQPSQSTTSIYVSTYESLTDEQLKQALLDALGDGRLYCLEGTETVVNADIIVDGWEGYAYFDKAVSVEKNRLTAIRVTQPPENMAYTYGQSLDPTGMVVMADYLDGSFQDVTAQVTFPALSVGRQSITLSYTDDGVTKTCDLTGLTVEPKPLDVSGLSWSVETLTYNGADQSVTLVGQIPEGVHVEITGNTEKNAGNYTAVATFTLAQGYSSENYEIVGAQDHQLSAAWSIAPKQVSATIELERDDYSYTGQPVEPHITVKDGDTLIPESEYLVTYRNNLAARTKQESNPPTVEVADREGGNYIVTGRKGFTIGRADLSYVKVSQKTPLVYNGSPQQPELTVSHTVTRLGEQTIRIWYEQEDGSISQLLPEFTEAGTYTVLYEAEADHHEVFFGTLEVTVLQAQSLVTDVQVTGPQVIYDKGATRLEDISLGFTGNTPGSLTLDAGQVLTAGTKLYNWTFLPEDGRNYTTASGQVSITVTEDKLESIRISKAPDRTRYTFGDRFDPAGMEVLGCYTSGVQLDITGQIAVANQALTVADTAVTVSYGGFTASQPITVDPKVVTATVQAAPGGVYDGTAKIPEVVVKDGDTVIPAGEYTLRYTNNIRPGEATVTVMDNPGGNYIVTGSTVFTIEKAPQAAPEAGEGWAIDYTGEILTVLDGYEVATAKENGEPVEDGDAIVPGTTLYIRKVETETREPSDWTAFTVASRPGVPQGITGTDETVLGIADGKISGITADMEYRIGSGEWKTGSGELLTGLAPATVLVRLKATATAPHGQELAVTIQAGTGLSVTFDPQGGTQVAAVTGIAYRTAITAPAAPTKMGYVFAGWFTDSACTAAWDFSAQVTGDMTLYAKWVQVAYTIIRGAGQTVTKGDGAAFTSDAPFGKLVGVRVDGVDVDAKHYTAQEGSTQVTLQAAWVETLAAGEHTLVVVSTDGYASTTFTVEEKPAPVEPVVPPTGDTEEPAPVEPVVPPTGDTEEPAPVEPVVPPTGDTEEPAPVEPVVPPTGDTAKPALWAALLLISGLAVLAALLLPRRRKEKTE